MTVASAKSERIEIRTTRAAKTLLRRAAASSRKNVTEFLLDAGIKAAEETLADRNSFRLGDAAWRAFHKALDRPVVKKPGLARLLGRKGVLG